MTLTFQGSTLVTCSPTVNRKKPISWFRKRNLLGCTKTILTKVGKNFVQMFQMVGCTLTENQEMIHMHNQKFIDEIVEDTFHYWSESFGRIA